VLRFRVDTVAHAVGPGPILLGSRAAFLAGGRAAAATSIDPPLILPFEELAPPIVVTVAGDEDNADANTSLREAVKAANARPGLDRITFDPAVFPPGGWTSALLGNGLGALPPIDGDLVIDGTGAGFELAVNPGWAGSRRYGLRLVSGTLVVHGIAFRDLGHAYPAENLGANNCGSGTQHDGGAIRVDGGTLILYGNRFTDEGVGERNCRAASVRLHGGEGHRILNNTWTDPAMDALYIAAATREVSGNVINAGRAPGKTDDCIAIDSQGGADLWIIGNVCVDQELTAVTAGGSDPGRLYIVHNTFVRNRGPGAVHRAGAARRVELHGNVYHANPQAAISADAGGINLLISHEAEVGSARFCTACGSAVIQTSTISSGVDLGLLVPAGSTPADVTPRTASPLVDSGLDLVDRNGSIPRRFNGAGPERGAIELP
jgi:CSLREA domain-containing protein